MYYLKLFQSHSDYQDFVSGDTMLKPNVSHCVQENHVHYNPGELKVIMITGYSYLYHDYWTRLDYIVTGDYGELVSGYINIYNDAVSGERTGTMNLENYEGNWYFDGYLKDSYITMNMTTSSGKVLTSERYYIDTLLFQ